MRPAKFYQKSPTISNPLYISAAMSIRAYSADTFLQITWDTWHPKYESVPCFHRPVHIQLASRGKHLFPMLASKRSFVANFLLQRSQAYPSTICNAAINCIHLSTPETSKKIFRRKVQVERSCWVPSMKPQGCGWSISNDMTHIWFSNQGSSSKPTNDLLEFSHSIQKHSSELPSEPIWPT